MLERIKHNKIKNTGILYQILVRKMIQQSINGQKSRSHQIFQTYFRKSKQLSKELSIYNTLVNTRYDNESKAADLFEEMIQQRMKLDEIRLNKQKFQCIRQIKKHYDLKDIMSIKVDNYKIYASIYKVFESLKERQYNPISIVESKYRIIEFMLKPLRQQIIDEELQLFKQQSKQIKEKTLQLFIQKFNEKYKTLNPKQKQLLKKYTYSMSSNELHEYMNKQVTLLEAKLKDNTEISDQLKSVIENMDKIKKIKNTEDKAYSLLNLYQIEGLLV